MPVKGKGGKWDWAMRALRMWGRSDKVSASTMENGEQGLPVRGDLSWSGVAGPVYQGLARSLANPTLRGLWPSRSFIILVFAFSLWSILSHPLFMVWGKTRFENLDFCIWILNYSNTICWEIRVYSYVTLQFVMLIATLTSLVVKYLPLAWTASEPQYLRWYQCSKFCYGISYYQLWSVQESRCELHNDGASLITVFLVGLVNGIPFGSSHGIESSGELSGIT